MRVSEITIDGSVRIQTRTDALRVLHGEVSRENYIAEFGDVTVVWDTEFQRYNVVVFNVDREKYEAAKAKDCAKYGCE